MEEIKTKKCSKCGRELPLNAFQKCKNGPLGVQPRCKECRKKEYAEKKFTEANSMPKIKNTAPVNDSDNPLAKFTPRELMTELKRRGYAGTLTYTMEINIERL